MASALFNGICQTVLLRRVDDDPKVKLMHELLKARVRPYYIYMADQVAGGEHFRTPCGWSSGLAVPQFVIDAAEERRAQGRQRDHLVLPVNPFW